MSRILVETWGSPWGNYCISDLNMLNNVSNLSWNEVEYRLGRDRIKARTTVVPLIRKFKFDKVIILVNDTVACGDQEDYALLVDDVKRKYESFIRRHVLSEVNYEWNKISVEVIPSGGRFYNKQVFSEFVINGSDIYVSVLEVLAKHFSGIGKNVKSVEIFVDTTHGINVLPVVTYSIVKELADILAYFHEKVIVREYNSTPVVRNIRNAVINLIDEYKAKPNVQVKLSQSNKLVTANTKDISGLMSNINADINSACGVNLQELKIFISGIMNGLPLIMYMFFPDVDRLKGCIEHVKRVYENNTKIISSRQKLKVIHQLKYDNNYRLLIESFLIASQLKDLGISKKDEVTIQDIKKIRKIFAKNKRIDAIMSRDITELEELGNNASKRRWESLGDIKQRYLGEEVKYETDLRKRKTDLRTFLAHSGLTYDLVQMRKRKYAIFVRYAPDKKNDVGKFSIGCLG